MPLDGYQALTDALRVPRLREEARPTSRKGLWQDLRSGRRPGLRQAGMAAYGLAVVARDLRLPVLALLAWHSRLGTAGRRRPAPWDAVAVAGRRGPGGVPGVGGAGPGGAAGATAAYGGQSGCGGGGTERRTGRRTSDWAVPGYAPCAASVRGRAVASCWRGTRPPAYPWRSSTWASGSAATRSSWPASGPRRACWATSPPLRRPAVRVRRGAPGSSDRHGGDRRDRLPRTAALSKGRPARRQHWRCSRVRCWGWAPPTRPEWSTATTSRRTSWSASTVRVRSPTSASPCARAGRGGGGHAREYMPPELGRRARRAGGRCVRGSGGVLRVPDRPAPLRRRRRVRAAAAAPAGARRGGRDTRGGTRAGAPGDGQGPAARPASRRSSPSWSGPPPRATVPAGRSEDAVGSPNSPRCSPCCSPSRQRRWAGQCSR